MTPKHFFIGGAQRSGTTYTYHLCADHPQIEMAHPVKPEPKFFMNPALVSQGLAYYHAQYFGQKADVSLYGEKSTSYIEVEYAAQHIAAHLPDAKFVFILRNPVERAISNYWFSHKNGFETLPLADAIYGESARVADFEPRKISVSPYAYLKRGRYIDYLRMYARYFDRQQIHVMIYEQVVNNPQAAHDLYAFLGIDTTHVPATQFQIINANDDRPHDHLAPPLASYMHDYFRDSNAQLFDYLGYAVDEWAEPW
jgi:hypothetical protein